MISLFKISAVFFTVVAIISARLICHLSNCRLNLICKGSFTLVVVCSTVFLSKDTAKRNFKGAKEMFLVVIFVAVVAFFFVAVGCLKQWFN